MDNKKTVLQVLQDCIDELEKMTPEEFKQRQKELGLDKGVVKSPFSAYKDSLAGKSEEELAKMEKREKMAGFIKAVYRKDADALSVFKTMTEGTGSAGGFIVPEEFAAEVFRVVEDFGLVMKLGRKFPMSSDTLNVPRLSSSVTMYWPGETGAGTPSQPVFEQVMLKVS